MHLSTFEDRQLHLRAETDAVFNLEFSPSGHVWLIDSTPRVAQTPLRLWWLLSHRTSFACWTPCLRGVCDSSLIAKDALVIAVDPILRTVHTVLDAHAGPLNGARFFGDTMFVTGMVFGLRCVRSRDQGATMRPSGAGICACYGGISTRSLGTRGKSPKGAFLCLFLGHFAHTLTDG
jgi:hypothetical protein